MENINLFDIYIDEKTKKDKHSLAYSLKFCSKEKTLIDEEIDNIIRNILSALKKKFNISQR